MVDEMLECKDVVDTETADFPLDETEDVTEVDEPLAGLLVVARLGMRATGVGPRVLTIAGGVGRMVKRGGVKEVTDPPRKTGTLVPDEVWTTW